jgi:hypothetical protein
MFDSLLELIARLRVFGPGIIALDPPIIGRAQQLFSRNNYRAGEHHRQRSKKDHEPETKAPTHRHDFGARITEKPF